MHTLSMWHSVRITDALYCERCGRIYLAREVRCQPRVLRLGSTAFLMRINRGPLGILSADLTELPEQREDFPEESKDVANTEKKRLRKMTPRTASDAATVAAWGMLCISRSGARIGLGCRRLRI